MPSLNGISDRLPLVLLDLEQVAGAVILDRDDSADAVPVEIDCRQADQVGMIIFALFERRQSGAIDLDQRAAQRLGGGSVGNPFEARDRGLADVSNGEEPPFGASDVRLS